jgi:hypothetical protein
MDTLYGRSHDLRQKLAAAHLEYYADVPVDTQVYLCPPRLVYRTTKRGRRTVRTQVIGTPYQVRALLDSSALRWQTLELRANERGFLVADFVRLLVWTVHDGCVRQDRKLCSAASKSLISVALMMSPGGCWPAASSAAISSPTPGAAYRSAAK